MALELKQNLKLDQRLVMTPQLQQAIKLLQLSRQELIEVIQEELEINPVLEELSHEAVNETPTEKAPNETEDIPSPEIHVESTQEVQSDRQANDFDWENYLTEYSYTPPGTGYQTPDDEQPSFENFVSKKDTLFEHLVWQLKMCKMNDQDEAVGFEIIGEIDDDGYLKSEHAVEEISIRLEKPVSQIERVLQKIQEFDPTGVGARNLRECLLLQYKFLGIHHRLVFELINKYLPELEKKQYQFIAKDLDITIEDISQAMNIIATLEPRPGRNFAGDPVHYITPDIYLFKVGDEYSIILNEDGMPKLRISNYYRNALLSGRITSASGKDEKTKQQTETRDYIQERLRSASWLIKSINQRQKTIYKVVQSILKFQREFFDKGIEYLRPLVLRDVADDIEMHEATISRVTRNKYVHTPRGIFELKYFFNSSINAHEGEDIASESVKNAIKQLISEEDPRKPLSDQKIVQLLGKKNIDIARRTVAKYREMLGILSSSKRKKIL